MEVSLPNEAVAPTYRSGTAARLAGIPVATLRMWERRYRVVGPQTSPRGHRRYGPQDVRRLALIKSLVDRGHAIGTLAHLPLEALQAMSAEPPAAPPARARTADGLRVALVGAALAARAQAPDRLHGLRIVATCADAAEAAARLAGMQADVLAVELPSLREEAVERVEALAAAVGAHRAVVAYRVATEAAADALRRRGHAVVHGPLALAEIAALAGAARGGAGEKAPRAGPPPAPRFDEAALARLAQVSTTVRCECPRHIVDLLLSLGAFERYSAECENRSPEDAELHRYLGQVAGEARALFEEALVRVAQAEGIALPDSGAG